MPTYEYECQGCKRTLEVRQRITEAPLTRCEACGGELRRLLSPAPFILKGEGWYVTDYPSEARKKAVESEKKPVESEKKPAPTADSGASTAGSSPTGTASTGTSTGGPSSPPAAGSSKPAD